MKHDEARIEINGVLLSEAQSMALRVACADLFERTVSNPDALGTDEHGRAMTQIYRTHLHRVLVLISGEGA